MKKLQTAQTEDYQMEYLDDIELTKEDNQEYEKQAAQAEKDFQDVRVNFRWKKYQLEKIKWAAKIMGIPYQTYVKQVLLRQAWKDILAHQKTEHLPKASARG